MSSRATPIFPDEIIGFHTQQAVEKLLKGVIAGRGERFEHTHDLSRLLNLATEGGALVPVDADALIELTQYSVPLRYEDLLDAEPLDRTAAISLIEAVDDWARLELSRE